MGFSGGVGFGSFEKDLPGQFSGVDAGCSSLRVSNLDLELVADPLTASSSEFVRILQYIVSDFPEARDPILPQPSFRCLSRYLRPLHVPVVFRSQPSLVWFGLRKSEIFC